MLGVLSQLAQRVEKGGSAERGLVPGDVLDRERHFIECQNQPFLPLQTSVDTHQSLVQKLRGRSILKGHVDLERTGPHLHVVHEGLDRL